MIGSEPDPASRDRILTGLLGAPIAQSAAPAMHERAADALGLRCHNQLIEIAGAGWVTLAQLPLNELYPWSSQ